MFKYFRLESLSERVTRFRTGWPGGISVMAAALLTPGFSSGQQPASRPAAVHTVSDHFYAIGPAADWIEPVKPDLTAPHPFTGSIRPGGYFRLVDFQVHAETHEDYAHFAKEFLTVAGVHDDSEFQIEFDPAYQRLIIHRIVRHRGGQALDILDPDSIRITVPEDELDEGLLDGHVSVVVFLKDIRPGDVVEYDYTLSGRNPVFDGIFFDSIPVEWETSVKSMSYRLVKRPDRPLRVKNHGFEVSPARRPLPGSTLTLEEWIWSRHAIAPRQKESQIPKWFRSFAMVELSEFATWKEVAEWGARHYDFSHLPIDPDLAREVESIRARHRTPEDRALAAIRFVQDSIRYLGIEDGANAFRPAQPGLCFRRRFGDCKDKTVLLGQMLRELGIECDPVCVSDARRHTISEGLPSPMAFDHVVCRIRMPDGKIVWCDATSSHQGGGIGSMAFPAFGKGLVMSAGTTDLSDLPIPDAEDHRVEIFETFQIGGIGEDTVFGIETISTGSEADLMRYQLESDEPDAVRRTYLDYYREIYPDVEADGPIEVLDDRDGNRLIVRERYRIPDPWVPDEDSSGDGWHRMALYLQGIRDILTLPKHTHREVPLALPHPENRRHEIRLDLPGTDEDWSGFFDEERHEITSPAGKFERWMVYDSEKVEATVVATYLSSADHVVPSDLKDYQSAVGQSYDLSSFELWKIDPTAAKQTSSAVESDPETEEWTDEQVGLAFLAGVGALVAGVLGIGLGALVTFLVMRSRKSASHRPATPLPSTRAPARREPPPLPPTGSF